MLSTEQDIKAHVRFTKVRTPAPCTSILASLLLFEKHGIPTERTRLANNRCKVCFLPTVTFFIAFPHMYISVLSSGLGYQLAIEALSRSEKVIATSRARSMAKTDELKIRGAEVLELDVTAPLETLREIAEKAMSIYGRVDVLVNNAGMSIPCLMGLPELYWHRYTCVHRLWPTWYHRGTYVCAA